MAGLSPYQRLLTTLRHREPDRIPFDLSSTKETGIHMVAYKNLLSHLGIEEKEIPVFDIKQHLALPSAALLERLEVAPRGIQPEPPSNWQLKIEDVDGYTAYTDEWGITWTMPKDGGLYYDICAHPLAGISSAQELEAYPWPDPIDESRFAGLKEKAKEFTAQGYPVVLSGLMAGLLEMGFWLRGFENFYLDLALRPALVEALMEKLVELKMAYWEKALAEVGENILIVYEGDDLGVQKSTIISPEMYRRYVKPRQKRLFSFIKEKARGETFLFFHTCGSVYDILPDLVEVGIDILNPVQVSAANMDTRRLKKEFGDVLTFWGGMDTQRVLPRCTPDEVRDEVKRRIDDLAPGGGFVLNTVHNIQADVPPENIMAMWEALQDYGGY